MALENKLILKEIAKRWCKGIISSNSAMKSFCDTGFTIEEINYIQSESDKIAKRITNKETPVNVEELVNEYYD